MSRISTVYRVRGRFASQITTPSGRVGLISGGLLHVVEPPQLDWGVWKGEEVSLVPVNNRTPCWRETKENNLGEGKDERRHDHGTVGRRHVSRIVSSLHNADITIRELWKKAKIKK